MASSAKSAPANPSPGAAQAPSAASTAPAVPLQPVLPVDIIDASTQRLYAVSVFSLVQTYKLLRFAEVSLGSLLPWTASNASLGLSTFLTYAVLDGAILWTFKRLRIPRLDWSRVTLMTAIVLLVITDWLLLGPWTIKGLFALLIPTSIATRWETQLAIDEISVKPDSLIRAIDHIMGSFTIDVLPFATARLDAKASRNCLRHLLPSATVAIPLLLNNTGRPSYVSYSVTDFVTGQRAYIELEKADLAQMALSNAGMHAATGEQAIEEEWNKLTSEKQLTRPVRGSDSAFVLHISKTGMIRLERVLDADRNDVEVARNVAIPITQCPLISWDLGEAVEHGCQGQTSTRDVIVEGVPPLSMTYTRRDPPLSMTYTHRKTSRHFETFSVTDLIGSAKRIPASESTESNSDWAIPLTINVPVKADFSLIGLYDYRLEEVKDGLGYVHRPSEYSNARRYVHGHPMAEASIVDQGAIGLKKGRNAQVRINLRGEGDQVWKGTFSFMPSDGTSIEPVVGSLEMRRGSENIVEIPRAGTVTLVGLEGQYCPGRIVGENTAVVVVLPEPTLSAQFYEIKDECAGAVGIRAALTLTGRTPYTVVYSTKRNNEREEISRQRIEGDRGEVVFQPREYGKYTILLKRVDDGNYNGVPISGSSSADIRPLASARFSQNRMRLYSCSGESLEAPLRLIGEPPFKIRLDIVAPGHRKSFDVTSSGSATNASLTVPPAVVKQGGQFSASIVSIEDGRGCQRILSVPDLQIEVERDAPTARFSSLEHQAVKAGGTANLPLALTGEAPWKIRYRVTPETGPPQIIERRLNDRKGALTVSTSGSYTIISVSDAHCPGKVLDESASVVVLEVPRPAFALADRPSIDAVHNDRSRRRVCRGQSESLNLDLVGTPPFTVYYDVRHRSYSRRSHITAGEHSANLLLNTSVVGQHQYSFTGMTDALYSEPTLIEGLSSLTLDVLSLPEAKFGKPLRMALCMGQTLASRSADQRPALSLTGAEPFDIEMHLVEPNQGLTLQLHAEGVTASNWAEALQYTFSQAGQYSLALVNIRDANGCSQSYDEAAAPRLAIEVAATASIASTEEAIHHCIGDSIDFLLQGTSPWSVTYHWTADGNKVDEKTVSVLEPTFSRLASAPGIYRIRSIGHKDSSCRSSSDLVKHIHPLPTVRTSTGTKVREAIHAGEQIEIVFVLSGTPPFTFTYQRTGRPAGGKEPEVLEKHTVTDVQEHRYSIWASSAGTWEVTSISDAYCSYPKGQHKLITN